MIEEEMKVVVSRIAVASEGVVVLDLASADGGLLPEWAPGAHIGITLAAPSSSSPTIERHYSLCGDPADRTRWRIAVLRTNNSRGGSAFIHSSVHEGDRLTVRGPRTHFAFAPSGDRMNFVAGGIGITPILPMVRQAADTGLDWRLAYCGRSRASMAFLDDLMTAYPERVEVFASDEDARLDLAQWVTDGGEGVPIYICGPSRMIDEAEMLSTQWKPGVLHRERFTPLPVRSEQDEQPFDVHLAVSDLTLTVPVGRTVLDVVEDAGVLVLSSCREGTCGTCETPVLQGRIDHRDSVLTPTERDSNTAMMICVSRAACPQVVLEL